MRTIFYLDSDSLNIITATPAQLIRVESVKESPILSPCTPEKRRNRGYNVLLDKSPSDIHDDQISPVSPIPFTQDVTWKWNNDSPESIKEKRKMQRHTFPRIPFRQKFEENSQETPKKSLRHLCKVRRQLLDIQKLQEEHEKSEKMENSEISFVDNTEINENSIKSIDQLNNNSEINKEIHSNQCNEIDKSINSIGKPQIKSYADKIRFQFLSPNIEHNCQSPQCLEMNLNKSNSLEEQSLLHQRPKNSNVYDILKKEDSKQNPIIISNTNSDTESLKHFLELCDNFLLNFPLDSVIEIALNQNEVHQNTIVVLPQQNETIKRASEKNRYAVSQNNQNSQRLEIIRHRSFTQLPPPEMSVKLQRYKSSISFDKMKIEEARMRDTQKRKIIIDTYFLLINY